MIVYEKDTPNGNAVVIETTNEPGYYKSTLKLTSVLNVTKKQKITKKDRDDISASFQKTLVDILTQNSKRALKKYKSNSFILSGGVAANSLLRDELKKMCEDMNIDFYMPDLTYCTDNAAMIGIAASFKQKKYGFQKAGEIMADPNLKLV